MERRLIRVIDDLLQKQPHIIIAIDGRCAAGKSTMAKMLKTKLDCNVVSADSFFLRPEQRTPQRLNEAGGNVDYECLEKEVLIPMRSGKAFEYRPYNCHTQIFDAPITVTPKRINIVEGSYSCNPHLIKYYDYKIFMTVDKSEQLKRIEKRNGKEAVKVFMEKWIPLEEKYFSECKIKDLSDLVMGEGKTITLQE